MGQESEIGAGSRDIGSLRIDPNAEPSANGNAQISGQQEVDFYKKAGDQFHLAHNQQNLGYLGKLFGANSSAPTNIAGFVIICSFLFLLGSMFVQSNPDIVDLRKVLVGLITAALSFIFGAASKK